MGRRSMAHHSAAGLLSPSKIASSGSSEPAPAAMTRSARGRSQRLEPTGDGARVVGAVADRQ